MSVHFIQSCTTCGRRVRIKATLVNQFVSCRHCGSEFKASSASGIGNASVAHSDLVGNVDVVAEDETSDPDVVESSSSRELDDLMLRVDRVLARASTTDQPTGSPKVKG
ncbi:MAG: hypothetical protein AAF664_06345 [Planctomycetota bacterium]